MGKLPDNAKRVFKGVIYDVYHWEQEMFDGSKQTFEMLKRPDTVQVIPVVGNTIILIDEEQPHSQRFFAFPGGRVDEGEDTLVAAKRELLEETGYASDDWELLMEKDPTSKIEWTIYTYVARNCRKIQEPKTDPGEKIMLKPITFDEFTTIVTTAFYADELTLFVYRMKNDPKKLEAFKRTLFSGEEA